MSREVKIGMTDYSVTVFIPDSASTDGSGKTGLVAANLTVSGVRVETDNDVTVIDYTSSLNNLAALTTAHTDWGLFEISSTLAPGLYRIDIADAIFSAGAWSAVVYVMVTTSAAAATPMEFILVPQSPIDGVLLAPTTHTGAVIPTVTTTTTATNLTNAPTSGDLTATMKASVTTAATAATPIAASVSGAVGSVTAGVALTSGERDSVADALLTRNVSGGSSTGRTVKQALHVLRNKTSIAAGTLTVYDTDDTTSSFTAAVTTTAGDPISSIDPA